MIFFFAGILNASMISFFGKTHETQASKVLGVSPFAFISWVKLSQFLSLLFTCWSATFVPTPFFLTSWPSKTSLFIACLRVLRDIPSLFAMPTSFGSILPSRKSGSSIISLRSTSTWAWRGMGLLWSISYFISGVYGFQHSNNIWWRYVRKYIMDLLEYESASGFEYPC